MGDSNTRDVLVPLGMSGSVALSVALRRWFDEEYTNPVEGDDRTPEVSLLDYLADHDFGIGRWHTVPEPK